MSAGYDAEVADLFRDLRAASNLTEADLATRIAAPVEVVQALEQGAIFALPPWPETCRVVSAYGTLLNLDTRPLLRRIYAQLEAGVVELAPKPVQDVPVMVPPAGANPAAPQRGPVPQGGPAPQGRPMTQNQPGPPAGQPPQGWANGTPQPQGARQAPKQSAPQPTSAWPTAPAGAPQPGEPRAPQQPFPQARQPQAPQPQAPQHQSSQPMQPQPPQARSAPQQHAAPQAPWPGAAPQPGAPRPGPQGGPSALDIGWPGGEAAGRPAPQPQAAPPQPQADAGFPDAGSPDASFPDAGFPGEPQPYPQQTGYAPDSSAHPEAEDASFPGQPELEFVEEEEEDGKSSKSRLLKWGIIGLLAVVLLLGLWMVLGGSSGDGGLSSGFDTSDPVLDPDDPRSRKADRLPNNF
jgi:hypothetical protein